MLKELHWGEGADVALTVRRRKALCCPIFLKTLHITMTVNTVLKRLKMLPGAVKPSKTPVSRSSNVHEHSCPE